MTRKEASLYRVRKYVHCQYVKSWYLQSPATIMLANLYAFYECSTEASQKPRFHAADATSAPALDPPFISAKVLLSKPLLCRNSTALASVSIGLRPHLSNMALSSSQPLQSVVSIFSPVKIAFAPAMKQSICSDSGILIRPAASRMIVFGITIRAVAIH